MPTEQNSKNMYNWKNWVIVCLLHGVAGNAYYEYIQSGKAQVQILPNAKNL